MMEWEKISNDYAFVDYKQICIVRLKSIPNMLTNIFCCMYKNIGIFYEGIYVYVTCMMKWFRFKPKPKIKT